MTITWTILQLDRSLPDGAVYTAHWRVSAVDGDYSASAYSSASFTPDPASPDFIPYQDLTEAEVLGWVWASGVDKFAIEAALADQIYLQQNPVSATGIPW
jgi:hypothetical protein